MDLRPQWMIGAEMIGRFDAALRLFAIEVDDRQKARVGYRLAALDGRG